jgi:agmatinase
LLKTRFATKRFKKCIAGFWRFRKRYVTIEGAEQTTNDLSSITPINLFFLVIMLTQTVIETTPFLGAEVTADYDSAKVVILPIPFEATTTYRRGCENGPAAILEASHQVEYYDEELEQELWSVGIYTHAPIADTRAARPVPSEEMLSATEQTVLNLIHDNKFVIALGGEHSITTGIVEAYRKANPNEPFTVVQIDAHGDLRHEYEGSIHNHACIMRRVVDMGLPTVQIGIRSICKEEADLIKEKQLTVFRAREIAMKPDWIERAVASIPTSKVFFTIDLDGIDPTLMPGVGTPEPGGLNWYALTTFLKEVFTTHEVIGCDVMELAPITDSVVSEFTAAKLVYKLIGYQALAQGWL